MRVLIVEDEKRLAQALGQIMEEQHYQVDIVYDGADGLDYALSGQYDIVILDVMLPKKDGFEVVHELREHKISTPVLMLTARDDISDKVQGLDCGADDYMTKPFSMKELMARVKANIRRRSMEYTPATPAQAANTVEAGGLALNQETYQVTKNGVPVDLTQKEYDLLSYLIRERGKVFSREDLMQRVWNYEYYGDMRTVDVTVRRLREKIEDDPGKPRYILTRRGVGYYFAG